MQASLSTVRLSELSVIYGTSPRIDAITDLIFAVRR